MLRQKLREMKILSPKENLYSKLPEVRPPLLPTRDPNSPLPATPPVPAALVPGVERVTPVINRNPSTSSAVTTSSASPSISASSSSSSANSNASADPQPSTSAAATTSSGSASAAPSTSMSNTMSQNLMKMLNDPVTAYSDQVNHTYGDSESSCNTSLYGGESLDLEQSGSTEDSSSNHDSGAQQLERSAQGSPPSLAATFTQNVLAGPSTSAMASLASRNHVLDSENSSLDSLSTSASPTPEPIVIPRPQTNRKEKPANAISVEEVPVEEAEAEHVVENEASSTNITIIQLSSPMKKEPSVPDDDQFKSNVQIIPSNFTQPLEKAAPSSPKATTVHVSQCQSQTTSANSLPTTSTVMLNETSAASESCGHAPVKSVHSFGAVTNVPIGASTASAPLHYEQVFVAVSSPTAASNRDGSSESATPSSPSPSPKFKFFQKQQKSASQTDIHISRIKLKKAESAPRPGMPSTSSATASAANTQSTSSPTQKPVEQKRAPNRPLLTRGLTEAVITRSSRKDQPSVQRPATKTAAQNNAADSSAVQSLRQETSEQRKRSSSTSDTQGNRNRGHTITAAVATNNNVNGHQNANIANNNAGNEFHARRFQPAPQPFRSKAEISLHASARMTLREQQVMQLQREMMHPTGVRLQLRRKDCINSIALVDAFGAVW